MPLTVVTSDDPAKGMAYCPEDLEEMGTAAFSTSTLWTAGPQAFEGVWLSSLFDSFGLREGEVTLRATNDYVVTARIEDFQQGGALMAFRRNGARMTNRNKGLYWLVWNYDANPDFRTEQVYSKSVWQLDQIVISR